MKCPNPKCKSAATIRIVEEPRHIYRCVNCGTTWMPMIMPKEKFDKWNNSYIEAGLKQKAEVEKMVLEHLGLDQST